MHAQIVYKVPQGKLLRISVDYADGQIIVVQIHGDFFLHPEDAISAVEGALGGSPLERREIISRIDEVLTAFDAQFVGADSSSIATAILLAAGVDQP